MCKTLYVTDLDGTLLNCDKKISDFTANTVNKLVGQGMNFSYATARSKVSASELTKAITAEIPIIVYNGAFMLDNSTGEVLHSNFFSSDDFNDIFQTLVDSNIYPVVYSYISGTEKFSYIYDKSSEQLKAFLKTRIGDVRENPVKTVDDLCSGNPFYFTCIDEAERLYPIYKKLKDKHCCLYQSDIYTSHQWLEIMPPCANKANAALELKKLLGCDKLVAFGDAVNDIALFNGADECYAVQNACYELKEKATAVIESNDNDGVAKWLLGNAEY